jgi:tetratricopeptide (TPR) repeat protein
MKRPLPNFFAALALALAALTGSSVALADFDADLLAIQTRWADANYSPAGDAKEAAFDKLMADAAAFTARNPGRAEPLIWEGIVLSTAAGVKGGLGALGLAKDSRAKLEAALAIDPKALQGSAYTSLGTLYHKVPGFPVGFGSDKKAKENLEKSLAINPDGIDPNYFYGEFLFDEDDYAGARKHLEKALKAPPRPNRQSADEGRRKEIRVLLAKIPAA